VHTIQPAAKILQPRPKNFQLLKNHVDEWQVSDYKSASLDAAVNEASAARDSRNREPGTKKKVDEAGRFDYKSASLDAKQSSRERQAVTSWICCWRWSLKTE